MKPVNPSKLPADRIAKTFVSPDETAHLAAAAALIAQYRESRSFASWRDLESWSDITRMAATLGGVHPEARRRNVDQLIESVDAAVDAAEQVKQGKALQEDLDARADAIVVAIGDLTETIADLEAELADKRREALAVAVEGKQLADARELIATIEAEPADRSLRAAIWQVVRTGEHSFA